MYCHFSTIFRWRLYLMQWCTSSTILSAIITVMWFFLVKRALPAFKLHSFDVCVNNEETQTPMHCWLHRQHNHHHLSAIIEQCARSDEYSSNIACKDPEKLQKFHKLLRKVKIKKENWRNLTTAGKHHGMWKHRMFHRAAAKKLMDGCGCYLSKVSNIEEIKGFK